MSLFNDIIIKKVCPKCNSDVHVRGSVHGGLEQCVNEYRFCSNEECNTVWRVIGAAIFEWDETTEKNTVEIDVTILDNIIKYCEAQQIYDKLTAYGEFYYKIKRLRQGRTKLIGKK